MNALTVIQPTTLDRVVTGVCSDLSDGSARKYRERLAHFATWLQETGAPLSKETIGAYRRQLASEGKAPSTINGHLVAVRALLHEAAGMGLISPDEADRLASIRSVPQRGERVGNWLTKTEAQALIDAPPATLKGLRDRAILACLLILGMRRSEVAGLTFGQLQERDGHHIIADLIGKGGRVRTIKVPVAVQRTIGAWLEASGRELTPDTPIFVALRKGGHLDSHASMTADAIHRLVLKYGAAIERPEVRPHDLRRTMAKLARDGQAPLEQISVTLGHASLVTTQRYLGTALNLDDSATDRVGLSLAPMR
jgi:integrase/recombinase XerD